MRILNTVAFFAAALLSGSSAFAAGGAVADEFKWMTFAVFGVIIAITMAITFWAARTTHTTSEFYAAGRSVSGIQNGWAIAGDYLSAASFLGIAGLISLYGFDVPASRDIAKDE
jgi:cation/acetate symporter